MMPIWKSTNSIAHVESRKLLYSISPGLRKGAPSASEVETMVAYHLEVRGWNQNYLADMDKVGKIAASVSIYLMLGIDDTFDMGHLSHAGFMNALDDAAIGACFCKGAAIGAAVAEPTVGPVKTGAAKDRGF